jgi:uncharacterized membrane protein YadS
LRLLWRQSERRSQSLTLNVVILVLASLNTAELLPVLQFRFGAYSTSNLLTNASELFLAISMAAMGLEVNIVQFSKVGGRAMLVGTLAGLILLATSLLLIRLYL